jgi:hypothetical protein
LDAQSFIAAEKEAKPIIMQVLAALSYINDSDTVRRSLLYALFVFDVPLLVTFFVGLFAGFPPPEESKSDPLRPEASQHPVRPPWWHCEAH